MTKKNEGFALVINYLRAFFEGNIYPALIAALVLFGHILGIEIYFGAAVAILTAAALVICPGVKPFMISLLTFIFLVPLKHTPGIPTWSDYYFTGARLAVIIALAAILAIAFAYRLVRVAIQGVKRQKAPMIIPLAILSLAFLCNGFFASGYSVANLAYGLSQFAVYFLLFYFFYYGLGGENFHGLMKYVSFLTVLAAMVLVGEVAFMYLTYDNIFANGTINIEAINLGWGIWNPIGVCLSMLIPMQIFAAASYKRPYIYAITAALTYIAAILTLSRNAMIFATVALAASVLAGCFLGRRKKAFRIASAVCVGCAVLVGAVLAVLLFDKIYGIFAEVISKGFGNNGRFDVWLQGLKNFAESPIFGKGFFGFGENENLWGAVGFIPDMAHNTFVELLSAMGIFGLAAYLPYRVFSLKPFFSSPTAEKIFMLLAILTVLFMSMLDNFVFYIYTMFYPTLLLAVAHRFCRGTKDCVNGDNSEESCSLTFKISK